MKKSAKKTTAKKPAAKPAKKAAVKKSAAKKSSVKKTAVKKTAVKKSAKKSTAKTWQPAAREAVKAVKKAASKIYEEEVKTPFQVAMEMLNFYGRAGEEVLHSQTDAFKAAQVKFKSAQEKFKQGYRGK